MRLIAVITTAVVAGAVRYASEGPIPVRDDDEAQRLVDLELATFADEEIDEDGEDSADTDDLEALTVPALKKLAKAEEIDLGTATTKPDIIKAIVAHRAAAEQ